MVLFNATKAFLKKRVVFIIEFEKEEFDLKDLFDLGYFLEDLLGRKVELIRPCALGPLSRSHILNELENVLSDQHRLQHVCEAIEKILVFMQDKKQDDFRDCLKFDLPEFSHHCSSLQKNANLRGTLSVKLLFAHTISCS